MAAICAAIRHVGDPSQAVQAAQTAHGQQRDHWQRLIAALALATHQAGAQHVIQSYQDQGGESDGDAEADDGAVAGYSRDQTDRVQGHIWLMLLPILNSSTSLPAMVSDVQSLGDQWTGIAGPSNYAEQLASNWTVSSWLTGADDAMNRIINGTPGTAAQKTWVTMGDNRVRPSHADADGQTVDAQEDFTVGGESLAYPGDPAGSAAQTDGCRCSLSWTVIPPANQTENS